MSPCEVAKRLHSDIDPDLVAILEAVRHRLGSRIDLDLYAFYPVFFDTLPEGRS